MKYLALLLLMGMASVTGIAQTTIANLDDQNITSPNDYNQNYNLWAWLPATQAGCAQGCGTTGNLSHDNVHSVDGYPLMMNLANTGGCSDQCYGNSQMFNRIYHDDTASNATYLTLDVYATMDSVGNNYSQALEYGIEQDVSTTGMPGYADRYVYGMQCDYLGTGYWRAWWGIQGQWTLVADANTGQYIPCERFTPGGFDRLIFHFQKVDTTDCSKCTYYIDFSIVHPDGTSEYHPLNALSAL